MRNSITAAGMVVLLAGTVAGGWMQGQLTNRWGAHADSKLAAERLKRPLPSQVGNWRLRHEDQFSADVVRMLQCPAHLSGTYEHQQTGDVVSIAVIMGPPGPVAVHTPEICYSSRDYTITGSRRSVQLKGSESGPHAFWELPLKANDLYGAPLRVLYAWSSGTVWEAASHPRFGYGGLPHLYKLQMAVSANSGSRATEFDPAQDFLNEFLFELMPRLIEAAPRRVTRS